MATSTTPSWSALKRKDTRRHRRYAVKDSTLRVSWLDSTGNPKMAYSRVLNVCEAGMALELPELPAVNSTVRFQSEKHKLFGGGKVRHARRAGTKCIVGIEFADGLKWMPPEDENVEEPITLFGPAVE